MFRSCKVNARVFGVGFYLYLNMAVFGDTGKTDTT